MKSKIEDRILGSRPLLTITVTIMVIISMVAFEIIKEALFSDVLTRWTSHWMTIVFSFFLGALLTWIVSGRLQVFNSLLKEAEILRTRAATHQAVMFATQHYINNALTTLQLITLQAEQPKGIDPAMLSSVENFINKASHEIGELAKMENATEEEIRKFLNECLQAPQQ